MNQQQQKRPRVLLGYSKPSAQTRAGPAPLASFEDLPTDDQLSPLDDGITPTNEIDFDELEFDVEPRRKDTLLPRNQSPDDTLTPVRTPTNEWPDDRKSDDRKSSSVSQVTVTEVTLVGSGQTSADGQQVVTRGKSPARSGHGEQEETQGQSGRRKSSLAGFLFGSRDKSPTTEVASDSASSKVRRKSSGLLSFLTGGNAPKVRRKSKADTGSNAPKTETGSDDPKARRKSKTETGSNVEVIHYKNHHFDDCLLPGDERSLAYNQVRKRINRDLLESGLKSTDLEEPDEGSDLVQKASDEADRSRAYSQVRERINRDVAESGLESATERKSGLESTTERKSGLESTTERKSDLSPEPEDGADRSKAYGQVRERINRDVAESGLDSAPTRERESGLDSRERKSGVERSETKERDDDKRSRAYGQVRERINREPSESVVPESVVPESVVPGESVVPSESVVPEEGSGRKASDPGRSRAYDVVREQVHTQSVSSRRQSDWRPSHRPDSQSPQTVTERPQSPQVMTERPTSRTEKLKSPSSPIKVVKEADDRGDILDTPDELSDTPDELFDTPDGLFGHDVQGGRHRAYGQVRRQLNRDHGAEPLQESGLEAVQESDLKNQPDSPPGDLPMTCGLESPPSPPIPSDGRVQSPDMMKEIRLCTRKVKPRRQDTTDSEVSEVQSLPEILPSDRRVIKNRKSDLSRESGLGRESDLSRKCDLIGSEEEEEGSSCAEIPTEEKNLLEKYLLEKNLLEKNLLERSPEEDEMATLLVHDCSIEYEDENSESNESNQRLINGSSLTKTPINGSSFTSKSGVITHAINEERRGSQVHILSATNEERRGSQVQILSREERAIIKTLPLDRPRSLTPLAIAPLEEFLRRSSLSPDGSNASRSDRIKLSLPGEQFTGNKTRTPRKSNPQIWQDFCQKGLLGSPKSVSKVIINANNNEEVVIDEDFSQEMDNFDSKITNFSQKMGNLGEKSDAKEEDDFRAKDGAEGGFLSVLSGKSTSMTGGSLTPGGGQYDAFSPLSDAPLTPVTPLDDDFKTFGDTFDPMKLKPKSLKISNQGAIYKQSPKGSSQDFRDDAPKECSQTPGECSQIPRECNKCMCFIREKIDLLTSPGSSNDAGSPLIERDPEMVESQVLLPPGGGEGNLADLTATALETPEAEDVPLMSPNPCSCDCHSLVWRQATIEHRLSMSKVRAEVTSSKESLVLSSSSSTSGSCNRSENESKASQVKVTADT